MKRICLFLASLMLGLSTFAAPMRVATVHIPNLQGLIDDVVELADALEAPLSPEMVTGEVGKLLHAAALEGVDISKPIVMVGGLDADDPNADASAYRFSVTGDGTDYLDRVRLEFDEPEELGDGAYLFKNDYLSFFVKITDGVALAGSSPEMVETLAASGFEAESAVVDAMPGGVSVAVDLNALNILMRHQIERQKASMAAMKAQFEAEGIDTSGMFEEDPAAGMDTALDMINRIAAELDGLVMNLDLRRDITLRFHLQPRPGSMVSSALAEMGPVPPKIAGQRNPKAFLTFYGTMQGFDHFAEPYAKWVAEMYRQMGPPMDAMADGYEKMLTSMMGIYSGGYNFLMLPPRAEDWVQGMGVYEIHDAAKAREANELMIKMYVDESSEEDSPFTMTYHQEESEPYQGIAIDSYRVEVTFGADAPPMPGPVAALVNNLRYHVAYMDNLMPYALGDVANLHAMIDYLKSDEIPDVVHAGFADITAAPIGFWEFDLGSLIASVGEMMGPLGLEGLNAGLRGITVKEMNGVTTMIRLTREDMNTIKNAASAFLPKRGGGFGGAPADYDYDESWDDETYFEEEFPED
ncbi:MAG TPA: hypothetical protein PKA21_16460 [Kiritimatiellia bacterium]|nr:hypothetical protein [Kiritimatiellia bacterium]